MRCGELTKKCMYSSGKEMYTVENAVNLAETARQIDNNIQCDPNLTSMIILKSLETI